MANDCVWLLSQIWSVTLQFHDSKDGFKSLLDAQFGFLLCKQKPGKSADNYAECLIGSDKPGLLVHRLDRFVMKFAEHPSGLYIYKSNSTNNQVTEYSYTMVSTVAQQKKLFSPREISAADEAMALYRKIGRPD